MKKKTKERNHAREQAFNTLTTIQELVKEFNKAQEQVGNLADDAETAIHEKALSVEVRTDWHSLDGDTKPTHYRILIVWGGPAVQIVGELSEHAEPSTAVLQFQDWGTLWESYPTTTEEEQTLLEFAQRFYFGE